MASPGSDEAAIGALTVVLSLGSPISSVPCRLELTGEEHVALFRLVRHAVGPWCRDDCPPTGTSANPLCSSGESASRAILPSHGEKPAFARVCGPGRCIRAAAVRRDARCSASRSVLGRPDERAVSTTCSQLRHRAALRRVASPRHAEATPSQARSSVAVRS